MERYQGRLVADGNGNLLADEGPRRGEPVAFDEGQFIFVAPGEPSHNERHHQQFAQMAGTVDESMTDDPDLVNVKDGENLHHFEVQPDDPHYDEDAPNLTRPVQLPDSVSATITGHTEAYKNA